VCGNQIDAGNCHLTSANLIPCPASAVADTVDPTLQTSDTSSSSTNSENIPSWSIAMLVLASIMLVALLVIIFVLATKFTNVERA